MSRALNLNLSEADAWAGRLPEGGVVVHTDAESVHQFTAKPAGEERQAAPREGQCERQPSWRCGR